MTFEPQNVKSDGRLVPHGPSPSASIETEMWEAGFTAQEIRDWRTDLGSEMLQGGFSSGEVLEFFGHRSILDYDDRDFLGEFTENVKGYTDRLAGPDLEPIDLSLAEALAHGIFQQSAASLVARGAMGMGPPSIDFSPEQLSTFDRTMVNVGAIIGDSPLMFAGAFVGGGAGISTGPGTAAVMASAGAWAVPMGVRQVMMDHFEDGSIDSVGEFFDRAWSSSVATMKGALIGGVTRGTGLGVKAARTGVPGAVIGSEVATMVAAEAALRGELPEPHHFVDTALAILILKGTATLGSQGFRGARAGVADAVLWAEPIATRRIARRMLDQRPVTEESFSITGARSKTRVILRRGNTPGPNKKDVERVANNLRETYAKTGKRPKDTLIDAKEDPTIIEDLLSRDRKIPRAYTEIQKNERTADNLAKGRDPNDIRPKQRTEEEIAVLKLTEEVESTRRNRPDPVEEPLPPSQVKVMDRVKAEGRIELAPVSKSSGKARNAAEKLVRKGALVEVVEGDRRFAELPPSKPPPPPRDRGNAEPPPGGGEPPDFVLRVLDHISVAGQKTRFRYTWSDWYKAWVEDIYELNKVTSAMMKNLGVEERVGIRDPANDAYLAARMLPGSAGKAAHFLDYSPFKYKTGETVGKPLGEIMESAKKSLDDWRVYVAAKRALELDARGIKTGFDGGKNKDGTIRPTIEDARNAVARFGKQMGPIAAEIQVYQGHLLQYLADSGVLSQRQVRIMQEANKDYVPFFRVFDVDEPVTISALGKSLLARNPIFQIKGSDRRIIDPLESIIKNTYTLITMAERNGVGVRFVRLVEENGKFGQQFATKSKTKFRATKLTEKEREKLIAKYESKKKEEWTEQEVAKFEEMLEDEFAIFRPIYEGPKNNQIAVFRDGKREIWDVDPEIYGAFKVMGEHGTSMMAKFFGAPARTLRAGAILSPEFIGRNPFRDQVSAMLFSKHGFVPLAHMISGLGEMVANKRGGVNKKGEQRAEVFRAWQRSGGPMATIVSLDRNYLQGHITAFRAEKISMMKRIRNVPLIPFHFLRAVTEGAEVSTRLGEFKNVIGGREGIRRAQENGTLRTELEKAGFASREITLDFARAGVRGRALNSYAAFWNAHSQGLDKSVRAMRDNPVRFTAMAMAGITIPSVLMHLSNREIPSYHEIGEYSRTLAIHVPMGDRDAKGNPDWWFRLPRPFELGIIFGRWPELMVDALLDEDPEIFDDFLESLIGGIGGYSFLPTAAVPLMENYFGKSLFLNRPLVPARMEKILPELQAQPYTTQLSQFIGRNLADLPGMRYNSLASPIVLENFVQKWSGGLGMHVVRTVDLAMRKSGLLPDPPRPADTLADIPFVRGFVVRYPSGGARSITEFYENVAREQRFAETRQFGKREGDFAVIEREMELSGGLIFETKKLTIAMSRLSRLVRMVSKEPNMTPDEKRQHIDKLYFGMIMAAQHGNQMFDAIERQREALLEGETVQGPRVIHKVDETLEEFLRGLKGQTGGLTAP